MNYRHIDYCNIEGQANGENFSIERYSTSPIDFSKCEQEQFNETDGKNYDMGRSCELRVDIGRHCCLCPDIALYLVCLPPYIPSDNYLLYGEIIVIFTEALIYKFLAELSWNKAFFVSLTANLFHLFRIPRSLLRLGVRDIEKANSFFAI